jgi:hypothetical protein
VHLKRELVPTDEKRTAARVAFRDLSANVILGSGRHRVEVEDLSPAGARFTVHGLTGIHARGGELRLRLAAGNEVALPFVFVHLTPDAVHSRVVAQACFTDLAPGHLRDLSRLIVPRFVDSGDDRPSFVADIVVRGRQRVFSFLSIYVLARGRQLRVYHGGQATPHTVTPLWIDDEDGRYVLVARLDDPDIPDDVLRAPLRLAFSGGFSLAFFDAQRVRRHGDEVRFHLPDVLAQSIGRRAPRIVIEPGMLQAEISHPRLSDVTLRKDPTDLSYGGLSFTVDPEQDLLFPGERLHEMVLRGKRTELLAHGVVRSVRRDVEGRFRFGLELEPVNGTGDRQWASDFFSLQFPMLLAARPDTVSENFRLLHESGYTRQVDPRYFDQARASYCRAWEGIAERKNLADFLVYIDLDAKKNLGTVSLNRIFNDVWQVHHLGIVRDPGLTDKFSLFEIARDIYVGAASYVWYNQIKYFCITMTAEHEWNKLFYKAFLESLQHQGLPSQFDTCRVFRYSVQGQPPLPPGEVRAATQEELGILAERLAAALTPTEMDACEYSRSRLELKEFEAECAAAGLVRRRVILVTGQAPHLGFAVCELMDPGVNLFGFFNSVRMVLDDVPAAQRDAAARALLAGAMHEYHQAGVPRFVVSDYSLDEGLKTVLEGMGFSLADTVWRWLASREIVPYYMNYLNETMMAFLGQ